MFGSLEELVIRCFLIWCGEIRELDDELVCEMGVIFDCQKIEDWILG
jgi:hypothetical protein